MTNVLDVAVNDRIATVTMTRPGKRNAMNETLFAALESFFHAPPEGVRVVILTGTEGHFCAGLDLAEHETRSAEENLHHSRRWHRLMDQIQLGGLVVVSAMFGAVIGGGLELASATHVRV
ncbi:MAG: enoyl-CoA hydratase-related protein, partial [Rhodobiaceae bacterium]